MKKLLAILIILLTSAICSCRSQKHIAEQSTEQTTVDVEQHSETTVAEDLLAAIQSNTDVTLSEVTITFYPQDSVRHEARASPASVTIGRLDLSRNTGVLLHQKKEESVRDSLNAVATSEAAAKSSIDKDVRNFSAPSASSVILVLLIIGGVAFIIFRIRAPTK